MGEEEKKFRGKELDERMVFRKKGKARIA